MFLIVLSYFIVTLSGLFHSRMLFHKFSSFLARGATIAGDNPHAEPQVCRGKPWKHLSLHLWSKPWPLTWCINVGRRGFVYGLPCAKQRVSKYGFITVARLLGKLKSNESPWYNSLSQVLNTKYVQWFPLPTETVPFRFSFTFKAKCKYHRPSRTFLFISTLRFRWTFVECKSDSVATTNRCSFESPLSILNIHSMISSLNQRSHTILDSVSTMRVVL